MYVEQNFVIPVIRIASYFLETLSLKLAGEGAVLDDRMNEIVFSPAQRVRPGNLYTRHAVRRSDQKHGGRAKKV